MLQSIALILLLLALPVGPKSSVYHNVATDQTMQEREEYAQQQMTGLLQEVEQKSAMKAGTLLFAVLETVFYAFVGGLVVFPPICLLAWKFNLSFGSCSEQDSFSSEPHWYEVSMEEDDEGDNMEEDDDEEDEEEEDDCEEQDDDNDEDISGASNGANSWAVSSPSPRQSLPDTCKVLKELVGDLLGVCRVLCKKNFLLQMDPVIGMEGPYEEWNVEEKGIAYRLFVCLRPPPGHSFILEADTTGQMPERPSRIRVVLECICSRGQLLEKSLCFLHHSDDKLPGEQNSLLRRTLCTDSYLDIEKVTCHVQELVRLAWLLLPESRHCQLTVLPSSRSCRFQLTGSSKMNIFTEIIFVVEQAAEVPT